MRRLAILLALALPLGASADELGQPEILVQSDHVVALPFSGAGELGLGFLPQQDHIRMACWPGIADGTPDAWECLARGPEGGVSDLAPVTVGNASACGTTEGLGGSTAWGPVTDACAPYIAAADAAALSLGDVFAGDHTVLAAGVPAASGVLYDGGVTVAQGSCTWGAAVAQAGAASAWGVHACRWSGGTGTARYNGTETSGAATSTTYAGDLRMGRAATAGSAVGGAMQWLVVYDTTLTAAESVTPESLTWGAVGDDLRVVSEGRAVSKTCGTQTLGPNAPCVTADGLLIETGDSPTVSTAGWPVGAGEYEITVELGATPTEDRTLLDDRDVGGSYLQLRSGGTVRWLSYDAAGTGVSCQTAAGVAADTASGVPLRFVFDGGGRWIYQGGTLLVSCTGQPQITTRNSTAYLGVLEAGTGHLNGYLRLLGVRR